jgi:hypothetical protein
MGAQLEVNVGGRWLSMESFYGDVSQSTVWPGGSDELSWTPAVRPLRHFAGGEDVIGYFGGVPVWRGHLLEPDPSVDQLTATGAFREAYDYGALDSVGGVSKIPDTAIDQAIIRGLNWTRPNSIQSTTVNFDTTTGPVSVGALLDVMTSAQTQRWGVNPYRQPYTDEPTGPSYQTLPIAGGLGYALDDYASTLIGRYLDSTTSTYKTRTITDTVAETQHGHVERIVDLTFRGARSAAQVDTDLTNMLARDRSTPQWTQSIEVVYGELLSMGGATVSLETVGAGKILRVHGGFELAQRRNGLMYVDFLIGRTQLSGGTLTISPIQLAPRNLTDVLTSVAL